MANFPSSTGLICLICILGFASSVHCFGAGNIGSTSKIEGQNWRHGDIEDTLLTILMARAAGGKKFSKLDVKRVYFGNWLRDYSQAVDVGTVKYVSAEAIRILLWVLGFMSFGYGTKEFEVTTARLGCYRPEEHIDNPKNYADNQDARQYDRRLRGPVNERRELAVDESTGLKNYIANERAGIDTSAGLVRDLFGRCIKLGRQYGRSQNKDDLYEALRLLGTGCHCLEDFSAHSNYVELALIELGERDIFPHVGRRTQVRLRELRHPVYPLCTGTFGGTDFLHSVMGEFNDKATQSEIQELENTMNQAQRNQTDTSMLQDLLDKVPDGIFGGKNESQKADELRQSAQAHQMQNTSISPREPEEWLSYITDVQKQIYPIIEWHDEVMKSISETIDNIPILPDLLEQIQEQINIFVFSLLAPFVVPIINQVKTELSTGSSEIIESSIAQQHNVFRDDESSDPTHSMLSKDHFSNVLNEPAGKVASQVLKWVVPQLIACWDDERIDVDRALTRIIHGVLHHPALRDYGEDGAADGRRLMFRVVQEWWEDKSEREKVGLRDQLSRSGVESGRNHKPGVVDHGHGGNKPLGMPNLRTAQSSSAIGGNVSGQKHGSEANQALGKLAGEAVGGGALGSIVGGLAGGLLGGAFGGEEQKSKNKKEYGPGGSQQPIDTEYGQSDNTYGQARFPRTNVPGGQQEQDTRYDQRPGSSGGYGSQQFAQTSRLDTSGNQTYHHGVRSSREDEPEARRFGSRGHAGGPHKKNKSDDDSDDDHKKKKHERKEKKDKKKKKHGHKEDSDDDSDDSDDKRHRNKYDTSGNEYGRQRRRSNDLGEERPSEYGGRHEAGYSGTRGDDEYGRQGRRNNDYDEERTSGYGDRRETGYSGIRGDDEYGGDRDITPAYGSTRHGGESGYSRGGQDDDDYGRRRQAGSGFEGNTYTREADDPGARRGGDEYGNREYGGSTYGRETEGYGASQGYGREAPGRFGDNNSRGADRFDEFSNVDDDGRRTGGYRNDDDYAQAGYGSRGAEYGGESEQIPGGFGDEGDDGDEGRRRRRDYDY